ncbi:MAG: DUF424 family protein [Candidatus Nanohaloarchaea archaeon]|nr:DUF424 family protein [Candidatus Nanohaloarchaea archaeon]
MMFSCREIQSGKGTIVAACDAAILGDEYTEGGVTLTVDEDFYGGEEVGLDAVIAALDGFFTANLVGNELLDGLIAEGVVDEAEVGAVDGVRHVQLFRV